jgi:hypothetical protein
VTGSFHEYRRDVQLSFFTADSQAPTIADLEGLLAGPGQVVSSGRTARVSVVADETWRVRLLLAEFRTRGLGGEPATTIEGRQAVRTDFSPALFPLARNWAKGSVKAPPPEFRLDPARLRLWTIAAGRADDHGFLLPLGEADTACWEAVGAALSAAGLGATMLGPRAGGPAYRIVGGRRLLRLRELIGEPPPGAGPDQWPPSRPRAVRSATRPGAVPASALARKPPPNSENSRSPDPDTWDTLYN